MKKIIEVKAVRFFFPRKRIWTKNEISGNEELFFKFQNNVKLVTF